MLLGIDVGNTHTVIGIFAGKNLVSMWRIATNRNASSDELRIALASLFHLDNISVEGLEKAALASVVPQLTHAWEAAVEKLAGITPLFCCAETAGHLFDTNYPHPHEIGSDRVADAVAARTLYGSPVVVVDFGTATNIEVINAEGVFCGGIIAPGVQTSANALFSHGAQLPAIDLSCPSHVIGRSTTYAIQSGIMLGEVDRVDGLVHRIFDELGYVTTVIATGGLAPLIAPHSKTISLVNPELTLIGLRLISGEEEEGNE